MVAATCWSRYSKKLWPSLWLILTAFLLVQDRNLVSLSIWKMDSVENGSVHSEETVHSEDTKSFTSVKEPEERNEEIEVQNPSQKDKDEAPPGASGAANGCKDGLEVKISEADMLKAEFVCVKKALESSIRSAHSKILSSMDTKEISSTMQNPSKEYQILHEVFQKLEEHLTEDDIRTLFEPQIIALDAKMEHFEAQVRDQIDRSIKAKFQGSTCGSSKSSKSKKSRKPTKSKTQKVEKAESQCSGSSNSSSNRQQLFAARKQAATIKAELSFSQQERNMSKMEQKVEYEKRRMEDEKRKLEQDVQFEREQMMLKKRLAEAKAMEEACLKEEKLENPYGIMDDIEDTAAREDARESIPAMNSTEKVARYVNSLGDQAVLAPKADSHGNKSTLQQLNLGQSVNFL